jgi:hypothetical protein
MSGMRKRTTEQEWYRPKKENEVTYDEIKFVHALNSIPKTGNALGRGRSISAVPPKAELDLPAATCFIYASCCGVCVPSPISVSRACRVSVARPPGGAETASGSWRGAVRSGCGLKFAAKHGFRKRHTEGGGPARPRIGDRGGVGKNGPHERPRSAEKAVLTLSTDKESSDD